MPNRLNRDSLRKQRAQLRDHKLKAQKQIRGLNYHYKMYMKYFGMLKNLSNAEYRELLNDPTLVKRLEAVLTSDFNRLSRSNRVFASNLNFDKPSLNALPPEEIINPNYEAEQ